LTQGLHMTPDLAETLAMVAAAAADAAEPWWIIAARP